MDIDGTLTPNLGMPPRKFIPSSELRVTIRKALKVLFVSLCTGRDKKTVLKIADTLELNSPLIIEGGAKIIDTKGKTLWVQYMEKSSVIYIFNILKETKGSFSVIIDGFEIVNTMPKINLDKITAILWFDLSDNETKWVKQKLRNCSDISVAINQDRTGKTIYITHEAGTKAYGVRKLMDLLKIKKKETIGVGDGHNDISLLKECGLKIAMKNATNDLKIIAAYIAPSVNDDGITNVIEKFII